MSAPEVFHDEKLEDLLESATHRVREDRRNNFRTICLSSNLDLKEIAERFSAEFSVTEQGEFYHLNTTYKKYRQKFEVHLYLYEYKQTNTPIIFTLNSSEDIRRKAKSLVNINEALCHLWLPPNEMDAISDELLNIEGCRLTRFIGEKFGKEARSHQERRPEFERREEYSGDDAAQTLEEAKLDYGITPTKLEYELPTKANFTLSNEGEFVMKSGDAEFFFEQIVMDTAVSRVEDMNKQIQSSKLDVVEKEGVEVFDEKSLEIKLENSLDYEDADDLISNLKEDNFYPYNISAEQGSLLLTSRIIDEETGGMFSLTTDGSQVSVLPKHGSSFDSIMRFYRFLVEKFDTNADLIEV
ncbi:hypothetical protein [Haloarcula salina]|uniref:Uncharacterized protein n=1 Tax=Haloarcula salina TaxID=1429914 RepID=A0AA41G2Q5_9EURY|nr:hypothetical protein [Haloarcula salina]MBV0902354.1 hypothetical protein [Haloarcula salina]